MKQKFFTASRTALATVPAMLLSAGMALGHPGHAPTDVHSHTGHSSLWLFLGLVALGGAALIPLVRIARRRWVNAEKKLP